MRRTTFTNLALAAAVALAAPAGAYEATTVTDGGTLSGTVKFQGTAPKPATIPVTKDNEVCGKDKTSQELVVGSDGGIANAVVVVKATKGKANTPAAQNPVFDQKGCEYVPHILAFPAGTTVDVASDDPINHNIHVKSTANPEQNKPFPPFLAKAGKKIPWKVDKAEWPIHVVCDVHPWMSAYWLSMDQPYYAVTATDGSFKITDLVAGDYEVEIWQEKLGKKTEKVSIKPKEETKVDWKLGG